MNLSTSLVAALVVSSIACSAAVDSGEPTSTAESAVAPAPGGSTNGGTTGRDFPDPPVPGLQKGTNGFTQYGLTGCATAIATNDASTWVIGCDVRADGNHSIYRLLNSSWQPVAGAAKSIALSPEGKAWVVNAAGEVYSFNGVSFVQSQGAPCASAIGAGRGNATWLLGCAVTASGNHAIYQFQGSSWLAIQGEAKTLAVAPGGNPWVVNAAGNVYQYDGVAFRSRGASTCAREIGVGSANQAWIIGCERLGPDGFVIKGWTGFGWQSVLGAASKISVDPSGDPTVVNEHGTIFYATR